MYTIDYRKTDQQRAIKVLDLGCGEGRHSIGSYWQQQAELIVGLDLSLKDLKTANERLAENKAYKPKGSPCYFICSSGLSLPFADGQFDLIICSEVLEHIPDYRAFLQEIQRCLAAGGQLAVSVPRAWPERICWRLSQAYHQVAGGHVRIFTGRDLQQQILSLGFAARGQHYAHALHTPFWWLRCAFWSRGENFWPVRIYHKMLVWDLLKKPWLTRYLEQILNPILGKSLVMYFEKHKDGS